MSIRQQANLVEAYGTIAAGTHHGTVARVFAANRAYLLGWHDGPAEGDLYRSGVPHPPLNGVVRVQGQPLSQAYAAARERLAGLPRVWWVGPDSDPGTADGLLELGALPLFDRMPVMVAKTSTVADADGPDESINIEEATDVAEFVSAYARVSGIPEAGVPTAVEREKSFDVLRLVGRLADGRVAGTAEAFYCDGLVLLYFIGTQPEHRRRGIGTAMTRAVLRQAAARGVETAALTSSAMGEPVYRRLGFREIADYRVFAF
ncbi:GNAT family N-acetyltransferase [Actinoplanes solisilvae]|uniref:GNAT family N-acetyltransferase n=1 Tax=Actinoplanes solisilvae TaxID=2486853 RepID=UPI00196A3023|nr:GNAT family N-acetyltransferase [Actinoplanes solisilvae]